MHWYWIVVAGYAAVCIYIAIYTGGRVKSTKDYLIADRSLGPFVVACTWAATWVSASAFLGSGALAYRFGWPAIIYETAMLGGLVWPLVIAGKRLHLFTSKLEVVSIADYVGTRMDSKLIRAMISLLIIVFYFPVLMAQFKGAGIATAALMKVPYAWAVLGAGLIIVFYNFMGGFKADAYTDTFQAVVMGVAVIIAVPAIIWAMGGFSAINAKLAAQSPGLVAYSEPNLFTPSTLFVIFLWAPLVALASPYISVRFQVMRDWRILKKVLIWAALFNLIFLFITYVGIPARAEYGTALKDADMAVPQIITDKLHPFLSAVLIVGILAAMMSTTDSLLLVVGTALAHDIMKRGYWENIDDRRMLWFSRTIMLVVGIGAILLSLFKPPAFLTLLLYFGIGGVASSIIGPFVLSLYCKKITKTACQIAIPASFVFYVLISFKQFGIGLNVFKAGVTGMAFSLVLTYVLSRMTRQTISEETMQKVSEVLG